MKAIATHLRSHLGFYLEGLTGKKTANPRKAGDLNHTPPEYTARQLPSNRDEIQGVRATGIQKYMLLF